MNLRKHLEDQARRTHTNPTDGQKRAGNYRKGRVRAHGLDVVIENACGSMRSGKGPDGTPWKCRLPAHYGYISRTEGADGDHVDVYIGPHLKSAKVFVLDQNDADTGRYDEHKVFFGFNSARHVLNTYRKAFSDGKADQRLGALTEMTVDQFKDWLRRGDTTKPLHRADGGRVPHVKVTRDAFLYLDSTSNRFAQCGTCRFGHDHCAIMNGAKVDPENGSCGFYIRGAPIGHPIAKMTKAEVGYVDHPVRCENCRYFDHGRCKLYEELNREFPNQFDLDPDVHPKACCNAQVPRDGRAHGGRVGYAEGGDVLDLGGEGNFLTRLGDMEFSPGTAFGNRLFGAGGEDRYQTWPEKMIRSGATLPGDVAAGKFDTQPAVPGQWSDEDEARRLLDQQELLMRAQDTAGMAGGTSMARTPEPNAIGSGFTGRLYHGSPETSLPHLEPSTRGPLGPGVYTTPHESLARRYAGPEGRIYDMPAEGLDIFRGNGHRTDAEWAGYKDDVRRLVDAAEPEMRPQVEAIVGKMWSGDGYPLFARLSQLYGGDQAAQNLFKRAGFDGLSGIVDGHEVLLFGPKELGPTLMSDSGKPGSAIAGARRAQLPMDEASRMARAAEQGFEGPWYHGGLRMDRFTESGKIDPKRATSGPMPYFTDNPEMASAYAMGKKPDTSLVDEGRVADYFTVHPKDLGWSGRRPIPVEDTWRFLSPEQRAEIATRAKRIGYENPNEASGPLTLHPEGVRDVTLSDSHYDWILNNEARGNHLAALREMWHDSGEFVNDPGQLSEVYRLAGYPHQISETTAPWTEARGVTPARIRMTNPLDTTNTQVMTDQVLPRLEEMFKRDRSRKQEFGADMWDKNHRFTPKEWIEQAKEDYAKGDNSFVWTSIPDKITNALRSLGYDGILDTGGKMGGTGHTVAIPFGPEQVRSQFARFDPKNLGKSGLLLEDAAAPGAPLSALERAQRLAPLENDPNVWWHGSASGDLRGGESGLHLGTREAAQQALEARIGIPAHGRGWSGDAEYGRTLLAGQETLKRLDPRGYNRTGYNVDAPLHDYYPTKEVRYPDGSVMPMDVKPSVEPYRITGQMSNQRNAPHEDFRANGYMRGQLKRGAAKRGYYYRNVGEDAGSVSAVVPNGSHVERVLYSDSGNAGAPIAALEKAPPFFSAVERAVDALPQSKMTGDQWLGTLSNKPGVKPEELQWTGLGDFLAERKGQPVTKAEIAEHLADNQVRLGEVWKGADPETLAKAQELARSHGNAWDDLSQVDQHRYLRRAGDHTLTEAVPGDTKYHQYQLPGGENYREMLMTTPTANENYIRFTDAMRAKYGDKPLGQMPMTEAERAYIDRQINTYGEDGGAYKSSHWDEPNIVAHMRMNDRTMQVPFTPEETAAIEARRAAQPQIDANRAAQADVAREINATAEPLRDAKRNQIMEDYRAGKTSGPETQKALEQALYGEDLPELKPLQDRLQELRAQEDVLRRSLPPEPKPKSARALHLEEIQSDWGQQLRDQRAKISDAIDRDFDGIADAMVKAGVIKKVCD